MVRLGWLLSVPELHDFGAFEGGRGCNFHDFHERSKSAGGNRPASSSFPERDITILRLLYDTGVRVSELTNIKLEDIQFPDVIRIFGKGKKEWLPGKFASFVSHWLRCHCWRKTRRPRELNPFWRGDDCVVDFLKAPVRNRAPYRGFEALGRVLAAECKDKQLPGKMLDMFESGKDMQVPAVPLDCLKR